MAQPLSGRLAHSQAPGIACSSSSCMARDSTHPGRWESVRAAHRLALARHWKGRSAHLIDRGLSRASVSRSRSPHSEASWPVTLVGTLPFRILDLGSIWWPADAALDQTPLGRTAACHLDSLVMKSSDWALPRRPRRTGRKADHPRAIDRYITYFGDRTSTSVGAPASERREGVHGVSSSIHTPSGGR